MASCCEATTLSPGIECCSQGHLEMGKPVLPRLLLRRRYCRCTLPGTKAWSRATSGNLQAGWMRHLSSLAPVVVCSFLTSSTQLPKSAPTSMRPARSSGWFRHCCCRSTDCQHMSSLCARPTTASCSIERPGAAFNYGYRSKHQPGRQLRSS